jgi:predicted nucleic acid-binding protein
MVWSRGIGEPWARVDATFSLAIHTSFIRRGPGKQWARIKNEREKKGRPVSFADAWIAAITLQLNIPLVTHNVRDYEAIDNLTILTAVVGVA